MARKAKETPHLRLRVEPSLLAKLEKSAQKNERTLTGEIVDRLEASFKRDDIQAIINTTAERISEALLAVVDVKQRDDIFNKAMFDLDLKMMSARHPDTPIEEHREVLHAMYARRAEYKK